MVSQRTENPSFTGISLFRERKAAKPAIESGTHSRLGNPPTHIPAPPPPRTAKVHVQHSLEHGRLPSAGHGLQVRLAHVATEVLVVVGRQGGHRGRAEGLCVGVGCRQRLPLVLEGCRRDARLGVRAEAQRLQSTWGGYMHGRVQEEADAGRGQCTARCAAQTTTSRAPTSKPQEGRAHICPWGLT